MTKIILDLDNYNIEEMNYAAALLNNYHIVNETKEKVETNIDYEYRLRKDFKTIIVYSSVNIKTYLDKVEFRQLSFRLRCTYNITMGKDVYSEIISAKPVLQKKRANCILDSTRNYCKEKIDSLIYEIVYDATKALGLEMDVRKGTRKIEIELNFV